MHHARPLLTSARALALLGCAACAVRPEALPAPAQAPVAPAEHARRLYAAQCATCHGPDGRGNGPLARFLEPAPRAFAREGFRLISTASGAPSQADIVRTLRAGIPASAMPAFAHLREDELEGLAEHVRELALLGLTEELLLDAAEMGTELAPEEAHLLAARELEPGPAVSAGPKPLETDELLARGAVLYRERCAFCHGEDGRGVLLFDDEGRPTRPRDLRADPLRGGGETPDLLARILAGMPGSAMPRTSFDAGSDAWAVASYVHGLTKKSSAPVLAAGRAPLHLQLVRELPAAPDGAKAQEIALWPLRAEAGAAFSLSVEAYHDGRTLALWLRWPDATRDAEPLAALAPDRAAVMLRAEAPAASASPLPAMSAAGRPVPILAWQAFSAGEARGAVELGLTRPLPLGEEPAGRPDVTPREPLFHFEGAHLETLVATGPGAPRTSAGDNARQPTCEATYADGAWRLCLRFPCAEPPAELAFALWNGSAGGSGANKAISLWQPLVSQN